MYDCMCIIVIIKFEALVSSDRPNGISVYMSVKSEVWWEQRMMRPELKIENSARMDKNVMRRRSREQESRREHIWYKIQ